MNEIEKIFGVAGVNGDVCDDVSEFEIEKLSDKELYNLSKKFGKNALSLCGCNWWSYRKNCRGGFESGTKS